MHSKKSKNQELQARSSHNLPGRISRFLAWPLIGLIYIYRLTLSPFIGNSCRFEPTCSRYAEDALRIYGAFKGTVMAARRLAHCHPWHEGGYDPVK